jgi:phosphoribosylaminoimidazole carboxylase (NCAIR synthetase)
MALPSAFDTEVIGSGTFGESATEKISFYGTTPVVQRTAAIATSAVATASSADVTTALKAAVIDIMNTLEAVGLWAGSD